MFVNTLQTEVGTRELDTHFPIAYEKNARKSDLVQPILSIRFREVISWKYCKEVLIFV